MTAILGLTNGYLASMCFSYGPSLVDDKYKGKAGSSISFFLIAGIFSGTIYALIITQKLLAI